MTTVPEFEIARVTRLRVAFSRAIVPVVALAGLFGVGGDPFARPSGLLFWGNLLIAGVIVALLLRSAGAHFFQLSCLIMLGNSLSDSSLSESDFFGWGGCWAVALVLWVISIFMTWNGGALVRYRAY